MNVEVKKYLFGEIVLGEEGLLKGPFGSDLKKSLYVPKGPDTYKVYLQENILRRNNSVGDHYISKKYFDEKMSRYAVKEGDFIVTGDGTLGEIYQLKNITEAGIISSSLLRITLNKDIVDEDYFYYLFKALIKKQLVVKSNNSVLKHLPGLGDIRKHEIYLPKLLLQRKIGQVLSTLDKRIENLRAQNRVLEQTAKAIYDYTFLQCAGHKTTYNKTLNRKVPVDWEVKKLGDLCNIFTGKKDVSKRIPGNYAFFSCAPDKLSSNEYLYDGKAILVSGNGSYTGRVSYYEGKFDLYQRTYACVIKDPNSLVMPYLYFTMKYLFEPVFSGGTHGSAIPYIVMGDLTNFNICWNPSTIDSFISQVSPMFEKKQLNIKQIEALTTQRNTLLPLLMTGQIEV